MDAMIASNVRAGVLLLATVTTGLMAGLFAAFAYAVMPGLARVDDRSFVAGMRSINQAILNGWFALCFGGALVCTLAAVLLHLPAGDDEAAGTLRGKRLGLPREYFVAGMEPGVEARVREAVAALEAAGAIVEEVSLPHTEYGLATYYIVALAEALNLTLTAEGVETPGQRAALQRLGCRDAQGFLFARPMDVQELGVWLQANA